ncbi:Carboxypeptidase regulatory-like domain protein [Candidatus Anstonella stagnisolia]|nr:Carboxypeptidase regulatory-like domain protein [Candidatus Anstonella stagnisolia]
MKPMPLLLALLLLCSFAFSFWVQNLQVSVKDSMGNPVPDAQVEVHYQKLSKNSNSDGYATGFTDEKGAFSAKLTNTVQSDEMLAYTVSVNTFFWEGDTKTLNAVSGREASSTASFTYPGILSPYSIRVIDVKKKSVQGATVTLSRPIFATRTTDSKGSALFRMPADTQIAGTVAFEGASASFDSSTANLNAGTYEITVPLASDFSTGKGTSVSSHTLDLQILDSKKKPIAGLAINITPPTPPRTIKTDTTGRIRIFNIPYDGLNISFVHNAYPYSQEISPLPEEPLVIELHSLLKITDLRVEKKDEGCSQIFLNATDERPQAQTTVSALYEGEHIPKNFETIGQNAFAVAICSQKDVNVTITASNQFESESTVVLVKGLTLVPIVNNTALEVAKTVPTPEEEAPDKLLVVVQVFFLTVMLVTIFIFRASIVYAIRCVSQYIRNFLPKKKEGEGQGGQPPIAQ